MSLRISGRITIAIVNSLLCLCISVAAIGQLPVYVGGNGIISFGVSGYGAPVPGVPTYIPNNFTGRNDILASPGGTFLTANPVIANNILSLFSPTLPFSAFQVGGGNINGPFGAGAATIFGPFEGGSLVDPFAGGGSASYVIESWNAAFISPLGYIGPYGSFLSVAGSLPGIGSAGVAALRTHITSPNAGSPFFGIGGAGIELPQLVLADARIGPSLFSFVALGGSGGIIQGDFFGNFRGLAVNNFPINIPAGDSFVATSTLTAYADPANFLTFDVDPNQLAALGTTLPAFKVSGSSAVPEPGSIALFSGLVASSLFVFLRRRHKK